MLQLWVRREATASRATAHLQRRFNKPFNVKSSMNLVQCVCIWSMVHTSNTSKSSERADVKQLRTLFGACETNSLGAFGTLRGVGPMACMGEVHSCPLAQSSAKMPQPRSVSRASGAVECGCRLTTRLLIQTLLMKRSRFSDHTLLRVGSGRLSCQIERHVASGHAEHPTWCDARTRARGIAGRHEKRESRRDDIDPLAAVDYGYLELDGTEDDDEDDEF